MGHGTIKYCAKTPEGKALESPFSRLFLKEEHRYNAHAISLLAGALGPMQENQTNQPGKPAIAAGFTFLGQFIDHDLTEFRVVDEQMRLIERNPTLGVRQVVAPEENPTSTNGRTGLLDLDSVYGLLGEDEPALFDGRGLFLLGREPRSNHRGARDIQRNVDYADGRRIADPRNDENKIIVQLHILFMRLHNKIHETKGGNHPLGSDRFKETKQLVQKIYRQIVLCDYLPRIVQKDMINRVKASLQEGTSFYQKMNRSVNQGLEAKKAVVAMPVEFAHAAFRLGHSQLNNGYKINDQTSLPLFATLGQVGSQAGDLRGNQAITAATEITWSDFFGNSAQSGAPLDTTLPTAVFRLPQPAVAEPPISLAERNILRGVDFGLPSGQEVAVALRQNPNYGSIALVSGSDLGIPSEVLAIEPSLEVLTPLWYYILREAEVLNPQGSELGAVGGYIVAETLLGSLLASGFDLNSDCPNTLDDFPGTIKEPSQINSMVDLLAYLGEL